MSSSKFTVAVVFGGRSSEHSISCISAASVLSAIDREAFEVVAVGITRTGQWFIHSGNPDSLRVAEGNLPEIAAEGRQVLLSTDPNIRGFIAVDGLPLPEAFTSVDVVFPVLHGPFGEDGTIQGALEFAGLPCVGSGVFASAAAMDKAHMKAMLTSHAIPVGPYVVVTDREWNSSAEQCIDRIAKLNFPVFVKPARAGSSIGITKVSTRAEVAAAVEVARQHDPKVIVEAGFEGMREIECGVLVDPQGNPQTSVPAEIIVHGHDFYDFEAKYLEDSAELKVPAQLDEATVQKVKSLAIDAFNALDCEGFARCDFFVMPDGSVIINEVNTLPGFTPISMFPRMWQVTGMSYPAIVDALLRDGLRRGSGLR
jgi:D-alanine-D-alanine ligase